ncbi:50S ribosomal protein L18 [Candidatus Wolfebacteria bacterium]|nr:50S ribosomal protein L18 [Candidatus Wolfebacteria bacterium]
MKIIKKLNQTRLRRKARTKAKIFGTQEKPRLSVFRSNLYTYAQLIDDLNGKTLASASTKEVKAKNKNKIQEAETLGELIAKKAIEKKIDTAIFNRGGYAYHGRVKAVAEGARKAGLKI